MVAVKRRQFIAASSLLWLAGCHRSIPPGPTVSADRLVRVLQFDDDVKVPSGTLKGEGVEGILYTDLASVDSADAVTPTGQFYVIRTVPPKHWPQTDAWSITLHGHPVPLGDLLKQRMPQGRHLMECSGNERDDGFRLLSVADWDGVPLRPLLDRLHPQPHALVRVAGLETPPPGWQAVPDDVPGASWIFTLDQLKDAFLATHLNGAPLPPEHGQPVRLMVPGWYGCCQIKWVNSIELLSPDAPPSTHMSNYAEATHQVGDPRLARNYRPALITTAAIPIRVEEWTSAYRIVGLVWGGPRPVQKLVIRFNDTDEFRPVQDYTPPADTRTWALWSHHFKPEHPGTTYRIQLAVDDANLPTPRLDHGFCIRQIRL